MSLTLEPITNHGKLGPQVHYSKRSHYTTVRMIFSSPSPGPYRMFSERICEDGQYVVAVQAGDGRKGC